MNLNLKEINSDINGTSFEELLGSNITKYIEFNNTVPDEKSSASFDFVIGDNTLKSNITKFNDYQPVSMEMEITKNSSNEDCYELYFKTNTK